MGFFEEAHGLDKALKQRYGPNASYNWRKLYYRALKFFTDEELDRWSLGQVIEYVGQRERLENERIQALKELLRGEHMLVQKRPVGRRPYEWYDAAFEKIAAGMPDTQAFAEMCEEYPFNPDDTNLREAFDAAIKRRRAKATEDEMTK